jgi:hypothetical protein
LVRVALGLALDLAALDEGIEQLLQPAFATSSFSITSRRRRRLLSPSCLAIGPLVATNSR